MRDLKKKMAKAKGNNLYEEVNFLRRFPTCSQLIFFYYIVNNGCH